MERRAPESGEKRSFCSVVKRSVVCHFIFFDGTISHGNPYLISTDTVF